MIPNSMKIGRNLRTQVQKPAKNRVFPGTKQDFSGKTWIYPKKILYLSLPIKPEATRFFQKTRIFPEKFRICLYLSSLKQNKIYDSEFHEDWPKFEVTSTKTGKKQGIFREQNRIFPEKPVFFQKKILYSSIPIKPETK